MRTEHLQIKIMTLAEEAKIIRRKERANLQRSRSCRKIAEKPAHAQMSADDYAKWQARYLGYARHNLSGYVALREHRIEVVRSAARDALIAYGYLRGKAYRQIEQNNKPGKPGPDWNKVIDMIVRFGDYGAIPGPHSEWLNVIMAWRDADEEKKAA